MEDSTRTTLFRNGELAARQLNTLEQMLALEATSLEDALTKATDLFSTVFRADKVDAFIYAPDIDTLVALGTSDTPMGHRQQELGLDRLPISNGGSAAMVFQTGEPLLDARADENGIELRGIVEALGVRSTISAPLIAAGVRRGVLTIASSTPEYFSQSDLQFLSIVARWLGIVAHRAELSEQLAIEANAAGRYAAAEEIVTVLAHDLRNFLTPIKFRVDLVRRRATRDARANDVSDLTDASNALNRLGELISSLLDVERLERGVYVGTLAHADVARFVRSTVAALRVHETAIVVEAPQPVHAAINNDLLLQALENLLSNATKYSPPEGTVIVHVSERLRDDRKWVTIDVSDQGPGIAPEVKPRLFERFATAPGSGGLGLGLYVSRRIVEMHGGEITVESEPGHGTQFTIWLPASDGPTR